MMLLLLAAVHAVSQILPTPGYTGKGEVSLEEKEAGQVVITAHFEGLAPGRHALQLHAEGCSSLVKRQSAGAHFNPLPLKGCDPTLAILDIGEFEANDKGEANFEATLEGAHLDGENSLVGYSLVLHSVGENTLEIKGVKVASISCGLISLE